jgi:hypothetical protein
MRRIQTIVLALGIASTLALALFTLSSPRLLAYGPASARPDQPQGILPAGAHGVPQAPPLVEPKDVVTMSFGAIEVLTTVAELSDVGALAWELALAMDIPARDLTTAELMCDDTGFLCTDPAAVAVMGLAPGTWFPTHGPEFTLLSTGRAADVPQTETRPNVQEQAASTAAAGDVLDGLTNTEGGDLVRLHLQLRPPPDAKCLRLDFAFYTVDLPTEGEPANVCYTPVSDLFTAQVNDSVLAATGEVITAPNNIARNGDGDVVSVATMAPPATYLALTSAPGTSIPGAIPLLQLRQIVTPGEQLNLYLSIQDRGDRVANSAVALDNFAWIRDNDPKACDPSPNNSGDRDGDGLPDGWEEYGTYGRDDAGNLRWLDLKTLGADPDVKDVFVELDSLQKLNYDPHPLPDAIAPIVIAFARAPVDEIPTQDADAPRKYKGIRLHVDFGPAAPPQPPDRGAARGGNTLAEAPAADLCAGLCRTDLLPLWRRIDEIKRTNFAPERAAVFHYGLFAHSLAVCTKPMLLADRMLCSNVAKISGISRNLDDTSQGASDFVVSLGDPYWSKPGNNKADQQAGTFMHELGHNLGLNHYGTSVSAGSERVMNKPNHLSVMNYLYQTKGLVVSALDFRFDYLRYDMAVLDEHRLVEDDGLNWVASGVSVTYTLGARYSCGTERFRAIDDATHVNWNCNDSPTDTLRQNVNGDFNLNHPILSKLEAYNEWRELVFTGGLLNRQRSLLRLNLAQRTVSCLAPEMDAIRPASAEPAALAPVPAGPWSFTILRRLIMPPAIIPAAAERQALEELTPVRDALIEDKGAFEILSMSDLLPEDERMLQVLDDLWLRYKDWLGIPGLNP